MELLHSVPMRHFAISGPISRNQRTLLRILSYRGMRSWRYCEIGNRMPSACLRPSRKVWVAEKRACLDGWESPYGSWSDRHDDVPRAARAREFRAESSGIVAPRLGLPL